MSRTAIADVGDTLIQLLQANLTDLAAADKIALGSPVEAENQEFRLTLFLYSIIETPELKNQPGTRVSNSETRPAPLTLDLYYLLTGFAPEDGDKTEQTIDAHKILSAAMQVFYDNGIIAGTDLKGSLSGSGQELRLTLNPLSNEDLTRIWSVFPDMAFRASVSYLVTPVRIDSRRSQSAQRVVEARLEADHLVPIREGV